MRMTESTNLISGILFTLVFGVLSHFFYEWSGENPLVGLFFPVNESVWEHMKLLFFPALFYTVFEIVFLLKTDTRFLTARFVSIVIGMFVIPCLFFIYTGFLGKTVMLLDLLIFVISVLCTFLLSRYIELYVYSLNFPIFVLFVILLFLLILFFSFTFSPPNLPIFWEIT